RRRAVTGVVQPGWRCLRRSGVRFLPVAAFVMVVVLGCDSGAGSTGHACTQVGAAAGISVDVAAEQADTTSGGELEVCRDGVCVTEEVALTPSAAPTNESCESGMCSTESVRTGEKHGFVRVAELPTEPVTRTLSLHDAAGERVVRGSLRVTPEPTYPNGPDCPAGGTQAGVVVTPTGAVRAE